MIQHFEKNLYGHDFVVGDIHGCFSKLQAKLDKIGFDPETDRIFATGDLVDRGAESEESLDWLARTWFHSVKGNHEQMVIDAVDGWSDRYVHIMNGGQWFVDLPKDHQSLFGAEFKKLPIAIQVDTDDGLAGIVHAECPLNNWQDFSVALTEHNKDSYAQMAIWNREKFNCKNPDLVKGITRVYVGHTLVKEPVVLGNVHYIDTGAVFGRELTVVKI